MLKLKAFAAIQQFVIKKTIVFVRLFVVEIIFSKLKSSITNYISHIQMGRTFDFFTKNMMILKTFAAFFQFVKRKISEILLVIENHMLPQNVVCGSNFVFYTWGNVFLIAEAQGRIFSFIACKSPSWNTFFRKTAKGQLITNQNLWRIFVKFYF